jgi:hypothetical protein
VGKSKRGKGTKLMAVADCPGFLFAVYAASATPPEVTLVPATLAVTFTAELPEGLIGDKAYDSDPLDIALAEAGVERIAPHRANRKHPATQDSCPYGATAGVGRSSVSVRGCRTFDAWSCAPNTRPRTSWALCISVV